MEHSANVVRMALVISIIGHVLFMAFSVRDLRPTSHGEVMTVDLVPANEAPAAVAQPKTDAASQSAAQKTDPNADRPAAPEQSTSPSPKPATKTAETKPPDTKPAEAKATPPKAPQSQPDPAQLAKWAEQQMSAVTDPKAAATPPA